MGNMPVGENVRESGCIIRWLYQVDLLAMNLPSVPALSGESFAHLSPKKILDRR
jgi:hypothetical protein